MHQTMKCCSRLLRAGLGVLLFAGLADVSQAQKVDFSGQKITLAIATPAGGGYDLYGRLVARYLGSYLPGNPTLVPQNMPGA
jgi:tripartite-type tricarboxylate transporter receptor subunit TctC